MKHFLFFFFSLSALAQTNIVFDQIKTTGTGCPEGTVTTILSPDGTSMSLLFDEFRVEVPNYESNGQGNGNNGRGPGYRPPGANNNSLLESHKTCNIVFNTTLPVGKLVTGIDISLQARGNTMMDLGLQGYFSTILVGHRGLANSVGPQVKVVEKKMWTTNRNTIGEDWTTDTKVTVPLKASCASAGNRSIRFELKNHLEARILSGDTTKSGIITVDSNDTKGMLTFTLATTTCR